MKKVLRAQTGLRLIVTGLEAHRGEPGWMIPLCGLCGLLGIMWLWSVS